MKTSAGGGGATFGQQPAHRVLAQQGQAQPSVPASKTYLSSLLAASAVAQWRGWWGNELRQKAPAGSAHGEAHEFFERCLFQCKAGVGRSGHHGELDGGGKERN